jgi:hypothetical protein
MSEDAHSFLLNLPNGVVENESHMTSLKREITG